MAVAEDATGFGQLGVRVVATDNLAPVNRASIHLSAGPFTRTGETDDAGRLDFANLAAGLYRLTVEPSSGFVTLSTARLATLAEGQILEITIHLERTGAIAGRIVDDSGKVVPGVQVQAVRCCSDLNDRANYVTPSTPTDQLGRFCLFNVPPGEYSVVARYRPWRPYAEMALRSGYATTWFPGTTALRDAQRVSVRAGQGRSNVDFSLAPTALVRVVVRAVDSRGAPLGREAQVSLESLDESFLASSSRQGDLRDDGTFVFREIPPGHYFVVANTSWAREEAAFVKVNVSTEDVSLNIQTNHGASMSGRIVIEPPSQRRRMDSDLPHVFVGAFPPPGTNGPVYANPLAEVLGTARFELRGLRGPMVLSAELAGGAVVSIRYRGKEIAGKTFELEGTEVIDDVVVVLTPNVAAVDLAVVNPTATETEDPEPVLVVLFAEDPQQWHQGFLQYSRSTVGHDVVHVNLGRMVPGRYLAVAVPDPAINYPTDTRVLGRLRKFAVPVTLIDGEVVKATLTVTQTSK